MVETIVRDFELDELNSKRTMGVMEWASMKVAQMLDDGYEVGEVSIFPGDKESISRLKIEGYKQTDV